MTKGKRNKSERLDKRSVIFVSIAVRSERRRSDNMNQLYEKKCDCKQYDDPNDHRSALLKMELPAYEHTHYNGSSYTICRAIRFIGYFVVLILLGYSLWRIHVIESTLLANDRFNNITKLIVKENLRHQISARSIKSDTQMDRNYFVFNSDKTPRGMMLTAKNENVPMKKSAKDEEFEYLVHSLFDKIQMMHNDTDRSHFDNNMKAVFKAWFPVFDALLPQEMTENADARYARSIDKSSEESSEEKKQRVAGSVDKSSEESSEEKKQRVARSVDKSSEESSEEKKQRVSRSVDKSSEESSEEKPQA